MGAAVLERKKDVGKMVTSLLIREEFMEGVEFGDRVYAFCVCACASMCVSMLKRGVLMYFQVQDETWENQQHIACVVE